MDWNKKTKQIKMFLDEHPDTLFDIEITNHPPEGEEKQIKVNMTALEDVEEDDIEMTNHPPKGEEVEEDDIEMTEMT